MTNIETKIKDARLLEALDYLDHEFVDEVLDIIKVPSQKPIPEESRRTTVLSIKLFAALAAAILLITSAVPILSYIIKNHLLFPGSTVTTEESSEYYTETGRDSEYVIRGEFKYLLDHNSKTATLVGVEGGLPQNVEIPPYVDTYPVTRIGNQAFLNRRNLVSVVIPDTVREIGNEAFCGCQLLKTVEIPEGVLSIGNVAFMECSFLNEIVLPESVNYIGDLAFSSCKNLYTVTLPSRVEHFGSAVFMWCQSLKSVKLPEGIETLTQTFFSCTSLTEIYIPEGTKSLSLTFQCCDALTEVHLPDSLEAIDAGSFDICHSLERITIPSGVKFIGSGAFYQCSKLTDVSFDGSKAEWDAIKKDNPWVKFSAFDKVRCSDGYVSATLSSKLYDVITNKEKFTMNQSGVKLYLKDSTYPSNISDGKTDPWSYTALDMDGDGKNEFVVTNGEDTLILHDNGSAVDGYVLEIPAIFDNGFISHSYYDPGTGMQYSGICRLIFDADGISFNYYCLKEKDKNDVVQYYVNGNKTNVEEYLIYEESYAASSPEWHTIDYYIIKE